MQKWLDDLLAPMLDADRALISGWMYEIKENRDSN
jgi:hypothetical protein